jgi:NitT/TauT family transport system substrate-binding protein
MGCRLWLVTVATVVLSAAVAACGSKEEGTAAPKAAEPASAGLMLDYAFYGAHAPFSLAQERGYYDKAGVELELQPGQGSTPTIQAVATGKVDFGFASSLQLAQMKAQDPSIKVKVIAQINQRAPWYVAFIKGKGIDTPEDLADKTWAAPPGTATEAFYRAFMKAKGLPLGKFVGTTGYYQALLAGQVDVAPDTLTTYPYLEEAAEPKGVPTGYFMLAEEAPELDSYSWALIAHDDTLAERPDVVKRFVDATLHGWSDAIEDPTAAVASFRSLEPTAKDKTTAGELKYMLVLVDSPVACKDGMGTSDAQEWESTAKIAAKNADVAEVPVATELYTNDFLPSEPYIPASCK